MKLKSSKFRALQRAFDIRTYIKSKDPQAKDHGGEVSLDCPQCGPLGKSSKLWVLCEDKPGKKAGHWICYYCQEAGTDVIGLIRWIEDCSLFDALQVLTSYTVEGTKVTDLRKLVQDTLYGVQDIEATWDDDALVPVPLPSEVKLVEVGCRLPRYFRERGISRAKAVRYGLGYVEKDALDVSGRPSKYRGRLVVPIKMSGEVKLFVARYMKAKPPAGVKKTLYPFGSKPNRVLFNYDRAKSSQQVILVEDVFSAMAIGQPAMATLGTQFSQYQMELLLKTAAEEVVIIWDLDKDAKPGQSGYEKAMKLAPRLAEFWRVRVVKLPDDRDPDEIPGEELQALIEASPVMDESLAWKNNVRERLEKL